MANGLLPGNDQNKAMKIIKKGAKKKPEIKANCEECGCVFSFTEKEGKYFKDPRSDGNGYHVKCPQCKNEMFVDER